MLKLDEPRKLWRRYVVALAIVLALLGVSHAASVIAMRGSDEAARVIDIAGRLNMLSQRILYLAARNRSEDGDGAIPDPRLGQAIDEFEAAHTALLLRGGAIGPDVEGAGERTPFFGNGATGGMYDLTLSYLSRRFIEAARHVLDRSSDSDQAWRRMELMGPVLLQRRLDAAVALFERAVQDRTTRVETVARISFLLAILVVAGEALFIFLPAQRAVNAALDELERANADLQASKSAAEALCRSEHAAREDAERAREVQTRFLSYISHELRTPLNGVIGMLTLMGDDPPEAERREQIRVARDASDQLLSILCDVLDLSKLEAGRMQIAEEPFDIRHAAQACMSIMTPRARARNLDVETVISPALPETLLGDAGRLRQILTNLLGNAITYTDRGAVTVDLGYDPVRDGGSLIVRVSDTGPGIAETDRASLFQPFRQGAADTARHRSGTGLGLSICKQFVELMRGRIGVESRPGHGSCFWIEIPCPPAAAPAPGPEDHPALGEAVAAGTGMAAPARRLKVLVVDDNSVNRLVASRYIEGAGHDTEGARDGAAAVAAVRGGAFDLVLMDINMPGMDGFAATRAIRALQGPAADVPIIALTADAMAEDRARILAAGLDGYLSKPVRRDALMSAIERARITPLPEAAEDRPAA